MKERAIVIFEFEEKEGRKEEKLGQRLWNGLDCQARRGADVVFSSSDNTWSHAERISFATKGIQHWYHLLMRTTNKTPETRYQIVMIQPLSCHVI
jgi:hypothetical protein